MLFLHITLILLSNVLDIKDQLIKFRSHLEVNYMHILSYPFFIPKSNWGWLQVQPVLPEY